MRTNRLTEIAERITAHLKRFEAEAEATRRNKDDPVRYWMASAIPAGAYIRIKYVIYQGASMLTRGEAEAYLAWLDAGNAGEHYDAVKAYKIASKPQGLPVYYRYIKEIAGDEWRAYAVQVESLGQNSVKFAEQDYATDYLTRMDRQKFEKLFAATPEMAKELLLTSLEEEAHQIERRLNEMKRQIERVRTMPVKWKTSC